MGKRKLIIGNWKMNFSVKQAVNFANKLAKKTIPKGVGVIIAPHLLALSEIATNSLKDSKIKVAAQNAYDKDEGAFTGEVSMPMLRGLAKYVLVGHSERRHIIGETNSLIRDKVASAVRSGITPILCVGEKLAEHESRYVNQVIAEQLEVGLSNLTGEEIAQTIIAYEPVWAVGTGKYATTEDVERIIKKIRSEISSLYGGEVGQSVRVLYGGSVLAENANQFLQTPGVDGLLVGGASLTIEKFWPIVMAAEDKTKQAEKKDVRKK